MSINNEQLELIKDSRKFRSDSDSLIIFQLIEEIEKLRDNRKSLSITYIKLLSSYFELLDDHIPDWKQLCKKEIDQLIKLIEH